MSKIYNYHSVSELYYHLLLVTKYRKQVITDDICDRLQEICEKIASSYGITITEFNHDIDHVHILFQAKPVTELSKFINAYKSASSRLVKKEFPEIKQDLWEEMFWSRSYYLATTGGVRKDTLEKYIQAQGEQS